MALDEALAKLMEMSVAREEEAVVVESDVPAEPPQV